MRFSSDRRGRVLFSMVAVFLLLGTIGTGVYMSELERSANDDRVNILLDDFEAVVAGERTQIEIMAATALLNASFRTFGASCPSEKRTMVTLDHFFQADFKRAMDSYYDGKLNGTGDIRIKAGNYQASLSPVPQTLETINSLGMPAAMTFAGAVQVAGFVNLTVQRVRGSREWGQCAVIDFEVVVSCPSLFIQETATRIQYDLSGEGFIALAAERMLTRELARKYWYYRGLEPDVNSWAFKAQIKRSVECALELELIALLHAASADSYRNLLSTGGPVSLSVENGLDDLNFSRAPAPDEMAVDLQPFRGPVILRSNDRRFAPSEPFRFRTQASWVTGPDIQFTKTVYAGEETRDDYEVWAAHLKGAFRIAFSEDSSRLPYGMTFDIPVCLDLKAYYKEYSPDADVARHGIYHPEVEDAGQFRSAVLDAYHARGNVSVRLVDNGTTYSDFGDVQVDILLDTVPMGTFRRPNSGTNEFRFENVPSGPHTMEVFLRRNSNDTIFGDAEFLANPPETCIDIVLTADYAPSPFWSLLLSQLRNTAPNLRPVETLRFFADLLGYPVPTGIRLISNNSPDEIHSLLAWGAGLQRYSERVSNDGDMPPGLSLDTMASISSAVAIDLQLIGAIQELMDSCKKYYDQLHNLTRLLRKDKRGAEFDIQGMSLSIQQTKKGGTSIKFEFSADILSTSVEFKRTSHSTPWKISPINVPFLKKSGSAAPKVEKKVSWAFDPPPTDMAEFKIKMSAMGDILGIANMAVGFFQQCAEWSVADEETKKTITFDLQLNLLELMLKVGSFVVNTAGPIMYAGQGVSTGVKACRIGSQAIGLVTGIMDLYSCYREEAEKYDDDPYAWTALMTGFDKETLTFYLTLTSTIVSLVSTAAYVAAAYGATQSALTAAAITTTTLGPIGWIMTGLLLAITFIANSEDMRATLTATLSPSDEDDLKSSCKSILEETLALQVSLNGIRVDEIAGAARISSGASYNLLRLSRLTTVERLSVDFQNVSLSCRDLGDAKLEQARRVMSLRYSLMALWSQMDDLHDDDIEERESSENGDRHSFPDKGLMGKDHHYSGDIKVTSPRMGWKGHEMRQSEIFPFLQNISEDEIEETKVSYALFKDMWFVKAGVAQWQSTIDQLSRQVQVEMAGYSAAVSRCAYISTLPSTRYRPEWGYLQIIGCDPFVEMKLKIMSKDSQGFSYLEGITPRFSQNDLRITLTNMSHPMNIYVDPGNYSVECIETFPAVDALSNKKVSGVAALPDDPDFCLKPARFTAKSCNVFFDIENRCNGTVELDASILDDTNMVQQWVFLDLGLNNTTRYINHTTIKNDWLLTAEEGIYGVSDVYVPPRDEAVYILRFAVGIDSNGDSIFESNWTLNVSLEGVRNEQKRVMREQNGKFQDQLGYRLIIYDKLVVEKDPEGNEIRYMLKWERL